MLAARVGGTSARRQLLAPRIVVDVWPRTFDIHHIVSTRNTLTSRSHLDERKSRLSVSRDQCRTRSRQSMSV
jgi:hypothetical protein